MSLGDSFLNLTGVRKLELMRQAEAAECGLACVGMAASYHGHQTDMALLRRLHPVSLKGSTLRDIIGIAAHLNLGCRAVRCELEELVELRTPAILHWNMNHFVVLASASASRIVILDPARGRVVYRPSEIGASFTGVAVELRPTSKFQRKRERRPVRLSSLVRFDATAVRALVQGLVLSLLVQLFVLISPYFLQIVIDDAIVKGDLSLLAAIATGFALLKIFEVATVVLRGLVFQFLSNVMSFDMKASLFHHMNRLPLAYFHRRHIGDIQQRFQSLQPICNMIVNGAIAVLIDGILALSLCAMLFVYNFELAVVTLGGLILYTGARLAMLDLSKRLAGDLLVAQAKESTTFLESLRAMQTVKLAGSEAARENVWRNLLADSLNANIRVGNVNIVYSAISQAILGLSTIAIVLMAASASINGAMSIGMITAFLAYKGQLEQRATALVEQYVNWIMVGMHLERVADIALQDRETSLETPPTDRRLLGRIEVESVGFRYAAHEPYVLHDVSFAIEAGDFVAITGPSGAGKSTLLRLIVGLYEPTDGDVRLDGVLATNWSAEDLRKQMGVVMQDDTLLAGSIAENIAMFDERIDMERVREAAAVACVHDDIEEMPMGYRTLVGDMGSSLSGGQKQRILIARAIYRRPALLVLDEGTAHLDPATERRMNENLRALRMTRIVAAHRQETVSAADYLIELTPARSAASRQSLPPTGDSAAREAEPAQLIVSA